MRFVYGLAGLLLTLAFVSYPMLVMSSSTGAPAGFNGGPAGNGVCTACHGSFGLNTGTGSVSISAPETFSPGETVEITITVDNTTEPSDGENVRQGFLVSVEDAAAAEHVGTLVVVDEANTRLSSDNYITHRNADGTDGTLQSSWTVAWVAPDDAPGEVTIYVAGNAANFNGGPGGDYIYTSDVTMQRAGVANEDEVAPLAARIESVFPNPTVDRATVTYTLDRALDVEVTLYDGVGRVIRVLESGVRGPGPHTASVVASDLAAGTYFVQVRSERGTEVRALTVAR